MNDKYIVVNNINAGTKLSESSRFYLSDILTIIIMMLIAFLFQNFIFTPLQLIFVIYNAIVGAWMTAEVKSNPKLKRWKAMYLMIIADTSVIYALSNLSQTDRTKRILEDLNEQKNKKQYTKDNTNTYI